VINLPHPSSLRACQAGLKSLTGVATLKKSAGAFVSLILVQSLINAGLTKPLEGLKVFCSALLCRLGLKCLLWPSRYKSLGSAEAQQYSCGRASYSPRWWWNKVHLFNHSISSCCQPIIVTVTKLSVRFNWLSQSSHHKPFITFLLHNTSTKKDRNEWFTSYFHIV